MRTGTVKWFNQSKGFGFISPSDGAEDVFFHQSVIKSTGYRSVADGQTVEFDTMEQSGRMSCSVVTGPNAARSSSSGGDVRLSKALSSLLRHNAVREGFSMSSEGYVLVEDIISSRRFSRWSVQDVEAVVGQCSKQRFTLRDTNGKLEICANQGHSFPVADLSVTPLLTPADVGVAIHGTYWKAWSSIRTQGLRRMKRQHVHFAPGAPGEDGVISGMRGTCQVYIYLHIEKALNDGLELLRSANNVILCPGNSDGVILPKYFMKIIDARNKKEIPLL